MTNNAKMFIKQNIDLIQLEQWDKLLLKLVGDFGYNYDGDTIIAEVLRTLHSADIILEDNYEFYSEYGVRNFTYKDDKELEQDLVDVTYQKIDLEEICKSSMSKLIRCLNSGINKYNWYINYNENSIGYAKRICSYIMRAYTRNSFAHVIQIDDDFGGSIKLYKIAGKSCLHYFNNVGFVVDYSFYKKEINEGLTMILNAIHIGDMA